MNTMKKEMPVIHPGELLKSELIEANGLTVSEVAGILKVSRGRFLMLSMKKQI